MLSTLGFRDIKHNKIVYPIKRLKRDVLSNWHNATNWAADKKYIVFESDDWGSIRTASPKTYRALLRTGDPAGRHLIVKYDGLAS